MPTWLKKRERKITLAGCWAHVRRNFYEAREQAPQRCGWILRQIAAAATASRRTYAAAKVQGNGSLYALSQSRPICQRLHRALVLFKKSRRYLPQSFWPGHRYNWPLLGVYLEDGRIQIDNNLVQNSIRSTALGLFGDAGVS